MTRRVGILFAIVCLLAPGLAMAQFGGVLKKKKKFNTKKVKKLEKRIDKVVKEYEDGAESMWTATENVQNLVAQYKSGDFPVLTKNWATIKGELDEVKDDGEKKVDVLKQRALYFDEMDKRAKDMEAFITNAEELTAVKGKLTVPEKKQVGEVATNLKKVPKKNLALIKESKGLIKDATKMIKDLGKQVTKDPLKANDYKKMIKRLEADVDRLSSISKELDSQMKAAKTMLGVLGKLLEE